VALGGAEAKDEDKDEGKDEDEGPEHKVGRRDRPLISAPAGRYALRAFTSLREQWTGGERLDFPVSQPCCYLLMREETRGKRTDYVGMSTQVLKRWQDHQTHPRRGSKDLRNRSGASLLWPVAVVTGFSSVRTKAKKYALLFESMWQKPGKRIDPNDKTVGWDVRQRKWSDPDTGKIKPLDARDGLERLRARRVCPDPSQCWGDTVHTIAVLLRHPLWRPLKLTLYIFHPSFALCYNHALRALTDEDEFNPLPNVRVLGFWPARINRKLELLLAEGDDRARARDNEDEDAEDDGGARASAGDGEDRQ
jgi:predicted GIY-YIG superfamily endonuclease